MAADLEALRRAADLLDTWAKGIGYNAMINDTDPNADKGTRLYASVLLALVARARAEAATFRSSAMIAEATQEGGTSDG
jgi:hypothetical protein